MRKESGRGLMEILSQNLLRGTDENYEILREYAVPAESCRKNLQNTSVELYS
jgi:hypothetical protein